ncbi:MAG: hypothetical protein K2J15_03835, partial [Muribaculaceae bacterium]|nr:hypothetical protein [Muribaculaceae bacterium]
MKKFFSRLNILRALLMIGATAIILLLVPRADHQSYSYELNQPWKYPLLTAEFDTPILRDSTSARQMKDSIEANFIPFAMFATDVAGHQTELFSRHIINETNPGDAELLTRLVGEAYKRGIAASDLYDYIIKGNNTKYRAMKESEGNGDAVIQTYEGLELLTQKEAFEYIDSIYAATTGKQRHQLTAEVARTLTAALVPDVVLDSVTDQKYRSQEYLAATGALGVIKKGQRIVDRGEIITPQIFTNLNTYQEMLSAMHNTDTSHTYYYIGQAIYILLCWAMFYLFLSLYRKKIFNNLGHLTFLISFITLFVSISTLVLEYNPTLIYVMPFAIIPITVMVFFDSRTGIFALLSSVMLMALIATYQFEFIVLELAAGLAATFSIHHLSKRSQLLRTAGITLVVYCLAYGTVALATDGNLSSFSPRLALLFVFNSLILSFAYVL